jgi:hypothetical protein
MIIKSFNQFINEGRIDRRHSRTDIIEIDAVNEGLSQSQAKKIVDRVYPMIIKNLGRARQGRPEVEIHKNIFARLSGIEDMTGEDNPSAEYDDKTNKIFLYAPGHENEEQVIRSLLHEYTHAQQDPKKKEKNRRLGYAKNPDEIEAHAAEENWREYITK